MGTEVAMSTLAVHSNHLHSTILLVHILFRYQCYQLKAESIFIVVNYLPN